MPAPCAAGRGSRVGARCAALPAHLVSLLCFPPPPLLPPPTHNPHPPARATDTITTERALALLRASKRGKLPVVNAAGELVALATRALFKAHSGMPLGGGWAGGRRRIAAAAGCTGPGFCSGGLDDPGCGVVPATAITATYLPAQRFGLSRLAG